MALAARKVSQVITHMTIGFVIMFALTGSVVFSGFTLLVEPVLNVILLPFHERGWALLRARLRASGTLVTAAEKLSQTGLHMLLAFAVVYWATGSLSFGGVAAVIEPVCNVLLLPLHDRLWGRLAEGGKQPDRSGRGWDAHIVMSAFHASCLAMVGSSCRTGVAGAYRRSVLAMRSAAGV